jgi:glycerol uptake facilitator-like aquaporin
VAKGGLDFRPELGEFVGTLLLVTVGGFAPAEPLAATVLAWTLLLAALVYALGPLCGAHFNPAVTLAFAASGHFPWRRVPGYVVAQAGGALLASLILRHAHRLDAFVPQPAVAPMPAFILEGLGTFLLAFVIVAVARDERVPGGSAGLAIGAALGAAMFAAIPYTQAALNPARAFLPALVAGTEIPLMTYLVAPVAGAVAAMLLHKAIAKAKAPWRTPA